jgi:predicted negative regulator of RcsB-dependent stress response
MTLIFLKRNWRTLILMLVIALSVFGVWSYGASQYSKGFSKATATLQAKFDVINAKQAKRMAQESAKYQADKFKRDQEQDIQYVEVEKIVREPVYLNVCLDDDGLSEINKAAGN